MFGKVVGGLPVLDALEGRAVGTGDKPVDAINILKATVFANPAADWDAAAPARVAEAARVEAEAEATAARLDVENAEEVRTAEGASLWARCLLLSVFLLWCSGSAV